MWRLKTPNYKSLTLFPFISKGQSSDSTQKHLAVTPLFWHLKNQEGHINILFPILFNRKKGDTDSMKHSKVIFPFYWSFKNQLKDKSNTVLFPLIWNLKTPEYKSFTFLPFMSKGHTPDSLSKHLVITPLFWHLKNPDGHRNILLPLLYNSTTGIGKNEKRSNVIFPFYWSFKDKFRDENNTVLFPIIWNFKKSDYKSFTFIPFMSVGNSPDSLYKHLAITPLFLHFKNPEGYKNILLPLFYNSKKGTGDNEERSNVILPFYL